MSGSGSTPPVRGQLHALPAEREVPAGAGRRPGVEQPPGLLPHHPRHARALGQGAARQVAATRARTRVTRHVQVRLLLRRRRPDHLQPQLHPELRRRGGAEVHVSTRGVTCPR